MTLHHCLFAVALTATITSTAVAEEARSLKSEECIASVFFHDTPYSNRPGTHLVLAIWEDGAVVYSTERVEGGPPFFTGKVNPEDVKQLVEKLSYSGVFSDDFPDRFKVVHHYPYTEIRLTEGSTVRSLASFHEVTEEAKGLATDAGIRIGNHGAKVTELASSPQEYLVFRLIWSEIRHELDLLRPKDAVPDEGELVYKNRTRYWQPKPAAP